MLLNQKVHMTFRFFCEETRRLLKKIADLFLRRLKQKKVTNFEGWFVGWANKLIDFQRQHTLTDPVELAGIK